MFSIVLCAHNPDDWLLERTLRSIQNFTAYGELVAEVLIIDNGSNPALETRGFVREFAARLRNVRVVREEQLGLAFARARGFQEAYGEYVLCSDDDNEFAENYLLVARRLMKELSHVGIWGPGTVDVEWQEGCDRLVMALLENDFNAVRLQDMTYSLAFPLPPNMPYGHGMIVRRDVAVAATSGLRTGRISASGRRGVDLAAHEDLQLCWAAMREGWTVGRHPDLRMRHWISMRHGQLRYVARRRYGYAKSYWKALRESLPEYYDGMSPKSWQIARQVAWEVACTLIGRRPTRWIPLNLAHLLGNAMGRWSTNGMAPPKWARSLCGMLYGK